jgi:HD-GYP domain-containing protein (c-di-GMP phosphodiesterase class II)
MIAPKTILPAGCALYLSEGVRLDGLERSLTETGVVTLPAESLLRQETEGPPGPAVLFVDDAMASRLSELGDLPSYVTIVARDAGAEAKLGDAADLSIATTTDVPGQLRVLRTAFQLSGCRREAAAAQSELVRSRNELAELNRLGMALMSEHDHERLLRQILQQVMRLTTSDAGALYLLERPDGQPPLLRFKIVGTDSYSARPNLSDVTFAVDSNSLIGHVALTGQPLVVDDAHHLPADSPYQLNSFVGEELGYWMKSTLTMPMIDHEGAVVGVLQLANRKPDSAIRLASRDDVERHAIPYSERDVQLGLSLAGQAAVSIENAQLYAEIENLLECFVTAAVTAIDQRDPATLGHSVRVAALVTELATAVERSGRGADRGLHFSPEQMRELRYAALLHDFGKVGVSEEVLMKARKLPPAMWARVESRFDLIRCTMELEYERKRAAARGSDKQPEQQLAALDEGLKRELAKLAELWSAIRRANEPTDLPEEVARTLADAASQEFVRLGGGSEPYLTKEELHYLQIPQGSLDEQERLEVESHAAQTYEFLSQIPWTDELKDIASYASGHHEKLNGSGYPNHLAGDSIPVQTRLITIADMFDALTATDRPYRPALSTEAALDIMRQQAVEGLLDRDIVDVLIESQVYRRT